MNTREVADRLVALCKEGKNATAMDELYSDDIVSLEATEPMRETRGIDGVRAKGKWWQDNHEVHSAVTEGPFVNGDEFAVRFTYDITQKANGKRSTMDEVAVYTVENGKITSEKFLY